MNNYYKEILLSFEDCIKRTVYSRNSIFALIRLVFFKYCIDNQVGAETKDNLVSCLNAQKVLSKRDSENILDAIVPVLKYLDEAYVLENILSSPESIEAYASDLGVDSVYQKKNATQGDYRVLLDVLAECDFDETDAIPVGRTLVEELVGMFAQRARKSMTAGALSTKEELNVLVKDILKVKSDDVFCDFASGIGLSTLAITKDTMPQINNIEIDRTTASLAAMLYIMYGYEDFSVESYDSLSAVPDVPDILNGNKVFVDAPLGIKIKRDDSNMTWDGSSAAIDIVLRGLTSEDGIAVITAPSSVLYQKSRQSERLRTELIKSGKLKAVIALPPMWQSTNIGTNLLVITGKRNKDVLLINAAQNFITGDSNDMPPFLPASAGMVNKISKLVSSPENVNELAILVSSKEIENRDYNLVPAQYVRITTEEDNTTVAEIDDRLASLYKQLFK